MNKALALALLLITAAPIMAAEKADVSSEIVYRSNLGRADDVKLLLRDGASPNQIDEKGVPLLALAASRKDDEGINVVEALLEAGADINITNDEGQTALFYAAKQGNREIVTLLLQRGINYYALDDNGDIARTFAHRAGHQDMVTLMDDFVKAQTIKVSKEYEDMNKMLAQRYREQEEAARKAAEQPPENIAPPVPVVEVDLLQQQKDKEAAEKKAEAYRKAAQELSFHNCAFQYWSFISAIKQSSELTREELDLAIDSHKDAVLTLRAKLIDELEVNAKYADFISAQSKQHIFNKLSVMPSKTYRREQGVGKMQDMTERCEYISKHWDEEAVPLPKTGDGTRKKKPPSKSLRRN